MLGCSPDPEPLVLAWCTLGSAFAAEIVGRGGADLVCVDTEHGLMGWDHALVSVLTLSAARIPVVVRVATHDPALIMQALDAGADGVIIPHVGSAAEATQVALSCRYPPRGRRSWGPTRSSLLRSGDTTQANDSIACIAMVETVAAAERTAEIAETPGIDAVLVGSNDLALDMIREGPTAADIKDSAEFLRLHALVASACQRASIPAAAPCTPSLGARELRDLGFRLVVTSSDTALLRSAIEHEITRVRNQSR